MTIFRGWWLNFRWIYRGIRHLAVPKVRVSDHRIARWGRVRDLLVAYVFGRVSYSVVVHGTKYSNPRECEIFMRKVKYQIFGAESEGREVNLSIGLCRSEKKSRNKISKMRIHIRLWHNPDKAGDSRNKLRRKAPRTQSLSGASEWMWHETILN
jgi:hypothetical protein